MIFHISSVDELSTVALEIKKLLESKKVLLLKGDLAAGKTTLVQAILRELGVGESALSPTFAVMLEYGEEPKIYHYDIYQNGSDKFVESNMWQNLLNDGYHFVEWADERVENLLISLGIEFVTIKIEKKNDQRIIEII